MTQANETCKDCRFCRPQPADKSGKARRCTVKSPGAVLVMAQGVGGPVPQVVAMWPPIDPAADWCGDFSARVVN